VIDVSARHGEREIGGLMVRRGQLDEQTRRVARLLGGTSAAR
jgi:hypothetical protein